MYDPDRHFLRGGIAGYSACFAETPAQPRLVVEATPAYLYSDLALRELPKLPSRPHILFLLREPASQIHSAFRYFQSNWNWIDPAMSFEDFIAAAESGSCDFKGNELARHALEYARYLSFLARWKSACGEDRIHVHLFEEAMADPCRFMQKLARRFGISAAFYDTYEFPAENQTYTVRSRALQKLNIAIRAWLPQGPVYGAMRGLYRQLNTRVEPSRDPAGLAAEARLAARYIESNRELAREFGLDLAPWETVDRKRLEKLEAGKRVEHVAG